MSRLMFIMVVASSLATVAGLGAALAIQSPHAQERKFLGGVDTLIAGKRYAEAEAALAARHPDAAARDGEVWLRLGICRSMRDDFAGAAAMFEAGLRAAPAEPKLLYNQALLHDRMGERDKCEAALRRLKAAAPYFPGVSYHLGRLAEERCDTETADEHYVAELNLDPASYCAWTRHIELRAAVTAKARATSTTIVARKDGAP